MNLIKDLNQNQKKNDVISITLIDNVNFDLWLILHKEDFNRQVNKNNSYISHVRRVYGLTPKSNIKNEKIIKKILDQIRLQDVKDAISRAEKIKLLKLKEDATLIEDSLVYLNPDFSIHEFLKLVLVKSGDLKT